MTLPSPSATEPSPLHAALWRWEAVRLDWSPGKALARPSYGDDPVSIASLATIPPFRYRSKVLLGQRKWPEENMLPQTVSSIHVLLLLVSDLFSPSCARNWHPTGNPRAAPSTLCPEVCRLLLFRKSTCVCSYKRRSKKTRWLGFINCTRIGGYIESRPISICRVVFPWAAVLRFDCPYAAPQMYTHTYTTI